MKYWDSSALVPLVIAEQVSPAMRALMITDTDAIVSFVTPVELHSAIARRSKGASMDARRGSEQMLAQLQSVWTIIDDYEAIIERAIAIARVHGLRSGDAIQLASALIACRDQPATLPFVTNDVELRLAAQAEGFPTLP